MSVWSLIVELRGAQGVMAAWGAFPAQLLTIVDGLADVVPCDLGHPCQRRIVEHAPNDVVGICDTQDGFCRKRQVSRKERVVYRLDEGKLFAAILQTAGGKPATPEVIADRPRVLRIGGIATIGDSQLPIFFALAADLSALDAAVTALLAHGAEKFLLVVPEAATIGLVQENRVSQCGGRLLGLDRLLEVAANGVITASSSAQDAIQTWVGRSAAKVPRDAEGARFPTPPGTQWKDITITFMDRDMLGIKCGKQSQVTKQREQIPGMTRATTELNVPSHNWELLLTFAVHGPAVSMADLEKIFAGVSSETLRRRKSDLSRDLKNYFGIQADDPIEYKKSEKVYLPKFLIRQADNTNLERHLKVCK